jgi:YVTN family beta-propeller protein
MIVPNDANRLDEPGRAAQIRTFLIADVRGYTRYTQNHGDAEASGLAQSFADMVRGAIASSGGELVELRGDEALCAFHSAREALLGAVELQRRCRAGVDGEQPLPLGVGVGLDAGEALPTEGGYRGGALNVAARLCALARPGEILASETVASLAGRHEGTRYAPRRPVRVKGFDQPLRHGEVIPGVPLAPLPPPSRVGGSRMRRRWAFLAALGVALSLVVAVVVISRTGGEEDLVPADSLAAIDPKTNSVLWHVSVGEGPTQIAISGGKLWTLNRDQTISLVDVQLRSLVKTFAIGATPAAIAAGASGVWVGVGANSSALKLNPDNAAVVAAIHAPPLTPPPLPTVGEGTLLDAGSLALSQDAVWFLSGNATLARIDPGAGLVRATVRHRGEPGGGPTDVAVGEGGVWVYAYNGTDGDLTRIDPRNNSLVASASMEGTGPLAVGEGNLWLVDNPKHLIWQIDPGSPTAVRPPTVVRSITVGQNPVDVAVGQGSVWVASGDGTISRIDPIAARVVETIRVGRNLGGITVRDGTVWVTVD